MTITVTKSLMLQDRMMRAKSEVRSRESRARMEVGDLMRMIIIIIRIIIWTTMIIIIRIKIILILIMIIASCIND